MLDLRRLRLLSELARRGTIAEVAKVAGYSPSAVSQSLAQLEREAGVVLLERDGRRVRLTHAAHALVARTDRILAELDAAEAELAAEHGAVRGDVVIGAFPSAATGVVVAAVQELGARHAELWCTIREHEPEDGVSLLRSGDLDLLVSESYEDVPAAAVGGLEQHLLLTEPLLLALPDRDRAADPVDLSTLADRPWITGLAGTQFAAAIEQTWRAAGFTPAVVHRADDATLHHRIVETGLGVGLLPALACTDRPGLRYVRARPAPPDRHVTALVRHGAGARPAIAATLAALRAVADDQRTRIRGRG
jgi:DNA-binding transcriptional LysR family regulator